MSRTVAVLGAGPALGLSVARRFGREGYRAALVARSWPRLSDLVAQLNTAGIEADAFPADLGDVASLAGLVTSIKARFETIDAVFFGPADPHEMGPAVLDITPEILRRLLDLFVHAPVGVVRLVLPEMRTRRDGALLFGLGTSAVEPLPALDGLGLVMSALRNYVHNLHAALAPEGVYAGDLVIKRAIDRSAFSEIARSRASVTVGRFLEPDALADALWAMSVERDRVELVVG